MLSANRNISPRQAGFLLILESFGAGAMGLPHRVAVYAAQDGWWLVLGLTLFAGGCAWLMASIARRFPTQSFIHYTGQTLSRPAAYVLGTGLAIRLLVNASLQLRLFTLLLRQTILPLTPTPVTAALITAVALYAAAKGIETRARVGEVLFFAAMLPLFALFLVALFDVDFTNLLPVFVTPPNVLLTGTLRLGYVFAGLESVLLLFPFLNRPEQGRRGVMGAVMAAGVLLTLLTAVTLAKFGATDVQSQAYPLMRMMDMLKIPGSLIERQDALVMSFWIITLFMVVSAALFYGAVLLRDMSRPKRLSKNGGTEERHNDKHVLWALICAIIVFGLACLPTGVDTIYYLLDIMYGYCGVFYLLVFPVVLLAAAKLRGNGKPNDMPRDHTAASNAHKKTADTGGGLS